jgi:starch-binding outer membrane protein, SusD/RagB family
MLNSIKKIFIITVALFTFQGCSDFLEMENPSVVTDDFYNQKIGQEKLLIDIYSKYRSVFNTGELQYYGTDLYMAITESPNERMFNGYDNSFNSTAGVIGGYWSNLYKIIQESNILLNRIKPTTPEMTQEEYNSITAQARFLRVLAYYYLVETFGPVPLLTSEQTEIITEVVRNPEEEIYSFMIDELKAIENSLPAAATEAGRISNSAVLHLLGKIYLTRAYKPFAQSTDFNDAASTFEKVIKSPSHALLAKFADVFNENNQNNAEVIWAIQYGTDKNYVGSGNPQQALFGFNIIALEPDMFVKNQNDYSSMNRLYWINPRVHELFTNPEIDSRYDATFKREFYINNPENANLGKLGLYFPRWNDASGDTKGASKFYPFKKDGEYLWYPQSTALPILQNGADRMPIMNKFKDTKMIWEGPGSREDIIFRLADTYLLCAEAYLGAGKQTEALDKLNTIRRRAAVSPDQAPSMELATITLDVLMDERGRELLGEHDRWFDLKRTGLLISRTLDYNILTAKYNNLNAIHLLRPIPQDERNKVKGLDQNPGYN